MLFPGSAPRTPTTTSRLDARLSQMGLVWTGIATVLLGVTLTGDIVHALGQGHVRRAAELAAFTAIVAFLIYGGLVYQAARYGHLRRTADHQPTDLDELSDFTRDAPALAILVPSYKEDLTLVRQTLLSAALQDYPRRRVVLLVDDPPEAEEDHQALQAARRLPAELASLLRKPAGRFLAAAAAFEQRRAAGRLDTAWEHHHIAALYDEAADWLTELAGSEHGEDHTTRHFVTSILLAPAKAHRELAARLRGAATRDPLGADVVHRHHRRLACLFDVGLTVFERKRFANLSQEPNKAMNLNSYMALLGGTYSTALGPDGLLLQPDEAGSLQIPDATYLITLDADSLLLPGYARRLVDVMERPGNDRVAVAQTPYRAIPGATGALERYAGATTDIMHVLHQGSTTFNATFWVGANALLRTAAMRDIAETSFERGYPVTRFIQDRTVIEDTESTVDLIARGWQLFNYPASLAYSATPPDYGALLIQRRRWANGGLLILPKLLRYAATGPGRVRRLPEIVMRLHYLTSITGVNIGLLLLLAYPFREVAAPLWLPLSALPYFVVYARDLVRMGYRASDVVRVYALNLLLLPVNLGGVLKSLHQAWSGQQIPFGRTPKAATRTPAPPLYLLATALLLVHWAIGAGFDLAAGRIVNGGFALANVGLLTYGITRFIGWRTGLADLRVLLPRRATTPGDAGGLTAPTPVAALEAGAAAA
jgi:cellulose synthase (UDP-forming)